MIVTPMLQRWCRQYGDAPQCKQHRATSRLATFAPLFKRGQEELVYERYLASRAAVTCDANAATHETPPRSLGAIDARVGPGAKERLLEPRIGEGSALRVYYYLVDEGNVGGAGRGQRLKGH